MADKKLARTFIAAAILALGAPVTHAEEREWLPYKKFVDMLSLDKFYAVDAKQRDHLRALTRLQPENTAIKPEDIVLTVVHAGNRDRLSISHDGYLELAPNPAWIREDAVIYTNMPKGEKAKISMTFASRTPDTLQLSYGELATSVGQWNAVIKEQAGVMRFMLPHFNALDIHFAKPAGQTLQVLSKDGAKTYTADAKGELKLKISDDLMRSNPQVIFSEKPALMEVDEI
ncbi:MAG: DUF2987 domain-containing protein [Burkholderiaceae bacterium]|nr:DUF2987 domain-containing protein [Burkholderiaceae bacterium]